MAGGDLRVRNDGVSGLGQDHQLEVIDAHSVRAGDFTEERRVGSTSVFLTPDGAAALDGLKEDGFTFQVQRDPSFWDRFLLGDRTGPKQEQFLGSTGEES